MWLIFDRNHDYLGELMTREGAMRSVTLTAKGEGEIGPALSIWQTQGIPVKHSVDIRHSHMPDEGAYYIERIQPRDERFAQAFTSWADARRLVLIDLPENRLWYWECLLRMPFSSKERFAYILSIVQAPETLLKELGRLFQTAQIDQNLRQSVEGKRAINQLKVKLAKQLTSKLAAA